MDPTKDATVRASLVDSSYHWTVTVTCQDLPSLDCRHNLWMPCICVVARYWYKNVALWPNLMTVFIDIHLVVMCNWFSCMFHKHTSACWHYLLVCPLVLLNFVMTLYFDFLSVMVCYFCYICYVILVLLLCHSCIKLYQAKADLKFLRLGSSVWDISRPCLSQCWYTGRVLVQSLGLSSPSPLLDNIRVMVIVWRLRGNIIRTALCYIVWHNVHSQQHTYVSSS